MSNLKIIFKIFDHRYCILQERYRIGDIDADVYGTLLKKLDNELKEFLDNNIKEEK